MPESHKAEKRRVQKANRAAGIGDAQGRLIPQKAPPKTALCTVCQIELTITKTNTELRNHAESKHSQTLEECFPGADKVAEEMIAAANKKSGGGGGSGGASGGPTKAQKKAKAEANMDDLLSAGLGGGPGKKGKK